MPDNSKLTQRPAAVVAGKTMSPSPASNTRFLDGGGEMGGRIRGFDWAKTPVGPIESWTPALRMMIGVLLANRFPLLLWWGPHYISFYNDAYIPILGTKHPVMALGLPVSECWSEIWHILKPLIDTPFQGGAATWMEDIQLEFNRHGFTEETHFTIAYSPVPDESVPGGIGGVLATVHEITAQVIAERRLVVLRELAAKMIEAKNAETASRIATDALALHDKDIPFALIYLIDANKKTARLTSVCGTEMGDALSPLTVDLSADHATSWPLMEAQQTGAIQVVQQLYERFGAVPPGPWSDAPNTAVVLPLHSSKAHEPFGLLVAGISVRLRYDGLYKSFLELLAGLIAIAISNAHAHDHEIKRIEALAEIDRAKTTFFSNASHEFRTPLTLILGPTEELLAGEHQSPEDREKIEMIHRNSQRLLKLVNTLLDFSRIEAGRLKACYQPTDLAAYTAELVSVFRAATQKSGLRLVVDCPPLPEVVYVDHEMWETIVLNLVSNALKFTFEGEIEIAIRMHGERVKLSVRDTGIGIPQSELPRIFERFHRVQGARSRTPDSTGIGLALVKQLVRLHGGEISVDSREGSGTMFTLSIRTGTDHLPADRISALRTLDYASSRATPFVDEALGFLPETSIAGLLGVNDKVSFTYPALTPEASPAAVSHQNLPRLILVDDSSDMRDYLIRLLSRHYRIEAMSDAQSALDRARAYPPDLLLTDVMISGLDGFGLLQQLRADVRTCTIPVIILSARAGEEARFAGIGAGANDYLTKPFSARELLARLRSQLDISNLRREGEARLRDTNAELALRVSELQIASVETLDARRAALNVMEDAVQSRRIAESLTNDVRESEERYRTLFNSMDEGYCILEVIFDKDQKALDYRYLEVNPAFSKQTGISDVLGKRIRELFPDLEEYWFETYGKVALTGEPVRFDNEAKSMNMWFDVYAFRIGEQGSRKVAVLFNNITERKRVETALLESESRYRTLFTSMDEGFCLIEMMFDEYNKPIDFVLLEVNPTFTKQTGLFEASGKRMRELVPDLEAHWFEVYGTVALTGEPVRFVNETKTMGGRWFDVYACRVGGPDSRKIAVIFNDITQRILSEDALRSSEERYRSLFNSMDEGYCIMKMLFDEYDKAVDYRFLEVNPAFEKHTGLQAVTGKRMLELVPDQDAFNIDIYASVALTGEPVRFQSESKALGRWFDIYAFRIGKPQSRKVAVIFNNINERKQFELNLKEAMAVADKANRAKTDFISSMSHELRTPLNAILGFAQLLDSGSPPPAPSQKQRIDQILKGGWYLLDLINEILDLALIESGKMPMSQEPVSLIEVMLECQAMIEPQAQKRGIDLTIPQLEIPGFVNADRIRLKQVLINLLSNAVKYNKPGGTVTVEYTQRMPDLIRISVRDTGGGLSAEQLAQLFQPFNRLGKENSTEEGTGIGLMMTKRLVELMGGVIGADSVPGMGSVFWIELNLVAVPQSVAEDAGAVTRVRSRVPPDGAPLSTLLYVEDNPANLELVEQIIARRSDLRLLSTTDGNLGIELTRTHLPQVILMDVNLPGINGIEVMNILRADPSTAHIPIIALSANALPRDIENGLEAGFFSYLTKPIKVTQFMDALDVALDYSNVTSSRTIQKKQTC